MIRNRVAARAFVGVAFAFAALSGCAFREQRVHIEGPEVAHTAPLARRLFPLTFAELRDERSDRSRVGIVKNGAGQETADVVTTDDVRAVVSNIVVEDLNATGFVVTRVASGYCGRPDEIVVTGAILDLMTEPVLVREKRPVNVTEDVTVNVRMPHQAAVARISLEVRSPGLRQERVFAGHARFVQRQEERDVQEAQRALGLAVADASAQATDALAALAPTLCSGR